MNGAMRTLLIHHNIMDTQNTSSLSHDLADAVRSNWRDNATLYQSCFHRNISRVVKCSSLMDWYGTRALCRVITSATPTDFSVLMYFILDHVFTGKASWIYMLFLIISHTCGWALSSIYIRITCWLVSLYCHPDCPSCNMPDQCYSDWLGNLDRVGRQEIWPQDVALCVVNVFMYMYLICVICIAKYVGTSFEHAHVNAS